VTVLLIAILKQATTLTVSTIARLRKIIRTVKHNTADIGHAGKDNESKQNAAKIHGGEIPFSTPEKSG
jgi:hypothetical protein